MSKAPMFQVVTLAWGLCLGAACAPRPTPSTANTALAGTRNAAQSSTTPAASSPHWPTMNTQFLTDVAATFNFRLGVPAVVGITQDGTVLFRRTPPRGFASDLYALDSTTGKVTTLLTAAQLLGDKDETLSPQEQARRERTRTVTKGIVTVKLDEQGQRLLVPMGERLFIYDRAAASAYEVTVGDGGCFDPQLSPDGKLVAFVRDNNLWLASTEPKPAFAAHAITAHPQGVEYGIAEMVAAEELHRSTGFWWGPDSKHLVFARVDQQQVETWHIANARFPDKPPQATRYPRPGKANAKVDLGVIALAGHLTAKAMPQPKWIQWDLNAQPYLANVYWPKGGTLAILTLNRAQTEIVLSTVNHATGAITTLYRETDASWINLAAGAPRLLRDGSFLWMTEASGSWVLEHRDAKGALIRNLTTTEFGLRGLAGLDEDRDTIVVTASTDPRQTHAYRLPLRNNNAAQAVTAVAEGGVHSATYKHGVIVTSGSLHAGGTRTVVHGANATAHEIPSAAEQPNLSPTTSFEEVTASSEGGTFQFYTTITRPRDFEANRKYPVLLKVYAGPHAQTVTDNRDNYALDQWYADCGFIVIRADGRGTPGRGRTWERAILGNLIKVPLADQIAALRAMASKHPEMDMSRVGVFGWSFGGYFATMAVLLAPEVFHAAVAGAPVTDWALYDTAYTERYMRDPSTNADGYKAASALTYAESLQRPLLIMHGITDDNVYFAHALALIEALYLGGKRAEVITLTGTHMVPDPKIAAAKERAHIEFFRQHLTGR